MQACLGSSTGITKSQQENAAGKSQCQHQKRGRAAEEFALGWLTQEFGLELYRTRWRTPFGEADLVLREPDNSAHLVVVEIKTLSHHQHLPTRVKRAQFVRLQRITRWLSESYDSVELWFAFVSPDETVLVLKSDEMNI